MISFIQGEVIFSDSDSICIFANGVGWNISVADTSVYLPGNHYSIYCYTHYTQDQTSLWGVQSLEELRFLKKLVSISGVGPRTATTLISIKGLASICSAIELGDVSALKVKGLGEKTIQKIIIELKGKIDLTSPVKASLSSKAKDILDALVGLGYAKSDVSDFLSSKNPSEIEASEEKSLIKEFLKHR